jgi:hypothetical protein
VTLMCDAEADRRRNQLLASALDAWEAEDGAFTEAELEEAAATVGALRGSST